MNITPYGPFSQDNGSRAVSGGKLAEKEFEPEMIVMGLSLYCDDMIKNEDEEGEISDSEVDSEEQLPFYSLETRAARGGDIGSIGYDLSGAQFDLSSSSDLPYAPSSSSSRASSALPSLPYSSLTDNSSSSSSNSSSSSSRSSISSDSSSSITAIVTGTSTNPSGIIHRPLQRAQREFGVQAQLQKGKTDAHFNPSQGILNPLTQPFHGVLSSDDITKILEKYPSNHVVFSQDQHGPLLMTWKDDSSGILCLRFGLLEGKYYILNQEGTAASTAAEYCNFNQGRLSVWTLALESANQHGILDVVVPRRSVPVTCFFAKGAKTSMPRNRRKRTLRSSTKTKLSSRATSSTSLSTSSSSSSSSSSASASILSPQYSPLPSMSPAVSSSFSASISTSSMSSSSTSSLTSSTVTQSDTIFGPYFFGLLHDDLIEERLRKNPKTSFLSQMKEGGPFCVSFVKIVNGENQIEKIPFGEFGGLNYVLNKKGTLPSVKEEYLEINKTGKGSFKELYLHILTANKIKARARMNSSYEITQCKAIEIPTVGLVPALVASNNRSMQKLYKRINQLTLVDSEQIEELRAKNLEQVIALGRIYHANKDQGEELRKKDAEIIKLKEQFAIVQSIATAILQPSSTNS